MSLPIVLREEASRDAEAARDYLEGERAGMGQLFLDRLDEALARIRKTPRMHGVVARGVRAARLRQFVYVIYYRVHADRIEVLAVMHGRRDRSAWKARD